MSSKGGNMMMPTGELQGENVGELPNKGTSRGQTGYDMHIEGASIDPDANNRIGGIRADSDPMDCCFSPAVLKTTISGRSVGKKMDDDPDAAQDATGEPDNDEDD